MNKPILSCLVMVVMVCTGCMQNNNASTSASMPQTASKVQKPPPPPPPELPAIQEKMGEYEQRIAAREKNVESLIDALKDGCFAKHRGEVILRLKIKNDGAIEYFEFITSKANTSEALKVAVACGEKKLNRLGHSLGAVQRPPTKARGPAIPSLYTFPL